MIDLKIGLTENFDRLILFIQLKSGFNVTKIEACFDFTGRIFNGIADFLKINLRNNIERMQG